MIIGFESVQQVMGLGGWVGLLVLAGAAALALASLGLLGVVLHWLSTLGEVRAPGLWGVTGLFGAGKTYFLSWVGLYCMGQSLRSVRGWRSAVSDGLVDGSMGRAPCPVFANYRLAGQAGVPFDCEAHGACCRRLHSWDDLKDLPWGSVVLLDESHLWWSSTEWNVDAWLESWVSQLRKLGCTVLFNAQSWRFVSTRLRRLAMGVWFGRGFARWHLYSLFDAQGFDSDRVVKRGRRGRLVLLRRWRVMGAYDTLEVVLPVEPPQRLSVGRARPDGGGPALPGGSLL